MFFFPILELKMMQEVVGKDTSAVNRKQCNLQLHKIMNKTGA